MILQDIPNPIVFSAFKTDGTYYKGDYLDNYDGFLANYGNSFSLESGIFTSPRKGIFEFSAATHHMDKGESTLRIEKNNIKVLDFSTYTDTDNGNDDTLSFSWIMELQQGDTIRLKVTRGGFRAASYFNWTFNGKFIRNI